MKLTSSTLNPTRITGAVWAAVAALGVLLGAGCGRPQAEAPVATPLRFAMDKWAGYYPLVLADALGYLRQENVLVEMSWPEDTHHMIADFAAGKHDGIFVSVSDVILTTRVQPAMRFILISDESAGGDQLLSHDELHDAAQIRGKRVGTTLGGFGEIFVRHFLERHGVPPDQITLVNADAANVPDLLQRGAIDIGHTWEPYASQTLARGYHAWFTSKDTPGLILDGLIVSSALIRDRPAQLQGLTRAWFRAVDWWKTHRAEGDALIEKQLKLAPGSASLEGIKLYDQEENRLAFGLSGPKPGALYDSAREHVEFFISRGQLVRRLKPEELLDPQFVR
jgi:NitT/TauT family transport system substrate-binding protein